MSERIEGPTPGTPPSDEACPGRNDTGLSALIEGARSGWNPPPEAPREEMWDAIRTELFGPDAGSASIPEEATTPEVVPMRRSPGLATGPRLAAAAAAVLLLGVGLGRMTTGPAVGPVSVEMAGTAPPAVAGGAPSSTPARLAAAAHLTSTETLLALVRSDARNGQVDPAVGRWGSRLLTETRLLLDSPAMDDPALRGLLEELEVVLAQVALLGDREVGDARLRDELELIAAGLEEGEVQARLRASLPSLTGAATRRTLARHVAP